MTSKTVAALLATRSDEEEQQGWAKGSLEECRCKVAHLREELLDKEKVRALQAMVPERERQRGVLREAFDTVLKMSTPLSASKSKTFLQIVDAAFADAEKKFQSTRASSCGIAATELPSAGKSEQNRSATSSIAAEGSDEKDSRASCVIGFTVCSFSRGNEKKNARTRIVTTTTTDMTRPLTFLSSFATSTQFHAQSAMIYFSISCLFWN